MATRASISVDSRMPRAGLRPMPSWDARKLKNVASSEGRSSVAAQRRSGGGITRAEGVEGQGRQGKVIDQMRLVASVSEIRDVIGMRDVRFRDQLHTGRRLVDVAARMRRMMRWVCSRWMHRVPGLSEKRNSVEAEYGVRHFGDRRRAPPGAEACADPQD